MLTIPQLPARSILGLNYSGMHDTTVAIVSASGELLFAVPWNASHASSKMDALPLNCSRTFPGRTISKVAVSTDASPWQTSEPLSRVHPSPLEVPRKELLTHGPEFQAYLDTLPVPIEYVCHELTHVSSAFLAERIRRVSMLHL